MNYYQRTYRFFIHLPILALLVSFTVPAESAWAHGVHDNEVGAFAVGSSVAMGSLTATEAMNDGALAIRGFKRAKVLRQKARYSNYYWSGVPAWAKEHHLPAFLELQAEHLDAGKATERAARRMKAVAKTAAKRAAASGLVTSAAMVSALLMMQDAQNKRHPAVSENTIKAQAALLPEDLETGSLSEPLSRGEKLQ